jgi:hypothetical protein
MSLHLSLCYLLFDVVDCRNVKEFYFESFYPNMKPFDSPQELTCTCLITRFQEDDILECQDTNCIASGETLFGHRKLLMSLSGRLSDGGVYNLDANILTTYSCS